MLYGGCVSFYFGFPHFKEQAWFFCACVSVSSSACGGALACVCVCMWVNDQLQCTGLTCGCIWLKSTFLSLFSILCHINKYQHGTFPSKPLIDILRSPCNSCWHIVIFFPVFYVYFVCCRLRSMQLSLSHTLFCPNLSVLIGYMNSDSDILA